MRFFSQTTDQRIFLMTKGFSKMHPGLAGYCREAVAAVAEVLGVDFLEFEKLVDAYIEAPSQYHPSGFTPAQERSAESVAQLLGFVRTHEDGNRLYTETRSTFVVDLNTGESVTIIASF